ncbi:MAG: site-2 protease family protein [Bacillota bacterium]|nr:site-2 protease family protein [Bacillota bacterium]
MKAKLHISPLFFGITGFYILADGTIYIVYIILSALLHEAAHIWMIKRSGEGVKSIDMKPFGVNIILKEDHILSYKREILISLAGPLVNLAVATIFLLINKFIYYSEAGMFISLINFALAGVNMLPIYQLDGGRIIKNLLLMKLEPSTADKICFLISIACLTPILYIGGILLYKTGHNFSLLIIGFYLLICLVIKSN